jgi:hypothetical protein
MSRVIIQKDNPIYVTVDVGVIKFQTIITYKRTWTGWGVWYGVENVIPI